MDIYSPVLTEVNGMVVTNLRTPSAATEFEGYDSILVSTWSAIDKTVLGDNLTNNVDKGVTVVVVQFAQSAGYFPPAASQDDF